MFNRFVIASLLLLAPAVSGAAEERTYTALVDVALFYSGAEQIDAGTEASAGASCVATYRQRAKGENDRTPPVGLAESAVLAARRDHLERQARIVSGDAVEAGRFARAIPISIEWEGMADGPLEEADAAEQWLAAHPQTPLRGFAELFIAHRYRAAFESAHLQRKAKLYDTTAKAYHRHLAAAAREGDPLVRCLAEEMDKVPDIYLAGRGRP